MDRFPDIGLIEKSLKRCMRKEGFLAQFYFELSNIHPTTYGALGGPELETYKENLNTLLKCLIEYGKGNRKVLLEQCDNVTGLNSYTLNYWEEALLISIAANDEKLDQETSAAWRTLIKECLKFLLLQKPPKKAA